MIKKLGVYLHTIKYLKLRQIFYRVYYALRKKYKAAGVRFSSKVGCQLCLREGAGSYTSYIGGDSFSFLNKTHNFNGNIDWDYACNGMLWAYNLNYFEFLCQEGFDKEDGL
jgi:hypothetical protein